VKIELERQVVQFVRSLAPEPRRAVREALRRLQHETGDIRALEGELAGFYRLRVGCYRVLFHYVARGSKRVIRCVYANQRQLVYEVFAHHFHQLIGK
jgi:mRNA interferase RelE/StbE